MNTSNRNIIKSPRLTLICCDKEILETLFEGEDKLAALLGISIPGQWTEFGEPAFRWTYDRLVSQKADSKWGSYLPCLNAEKMLVGTCGYKGNPVDGTVEIGYEVARSYRGNGLGSEIASALIKTAFQYPEVLKVQAHTLAEENESGTVLKKCGMSKVEELDDPDDGKIWRWEILKSSIK